MASRHPTLADAARGRLVQLAAEPADETFMVTQRVEVSYEYPVVFTRDLFAPANRALASVVSRLEPGRRHRLLVVIDDGVMGADPGLPERIRAYVAAHADRLELLGAPIVMAGGEGAKNGSDGVERLLAAAHAAGLDRQSYLVAIGGGALLDVAGYAAAICHRGVRHIRIPTTVLAQNDSGVGVKNGINAFATKNFLGTFAPPFAVLNDADFLDLLDPRDRRSGLAEAVKVALIRDGAFYAWLEQEAAELASFADGPTAIMIRRCAELHLRQIAHGGDPFEMGSARPLDFGHWAAHRMEALSDFSLRHGEAVAVGIALDARYSVLTGLLAPGLDERICALLERLGFSLWDDSLDGREPDGALAVIAGLRQFREHLGGELTVTLLTGIGRGHEVHEMDERLVGAAVRWLAQRARSPAAAR